MKKLNNKGFTLVELLAVIVILAILILLALPNVLRTMDEARKNSFKVEVQELLKNVETAYSMESMKGNVGNNGGVRTFCINLEDLYKNGYTNKKMGGDSGYTGFAEVFIPANGEAVFGINISNGEFSYILATPEALQLKGEASAPLTKFTKIDSKCTNNTTAVLGMSYYTKENFNSETLGSKISSGENPQVQQQNP